MTSFRLSLRSFCLSTLVATGAMAAAPRAVAQEMPGAPIETLVELADLLGRAHAIRSLCNGEADQTWRNYMFNMLAIEAPNGATDRKNALTGAFNRGFRDQQGRSGRCTTDSPRQEAEIAARGRALAETVAAGYLH